MPWVAGDTRGHLCPCSWLRVVSLATWHTLWLLCCSISCLPRQESKGTEPSVLYFMSRPHLSFFTPPTPSLDSPPQSRPKFQGSFCPFSLKDQGEKVGASIEFHYYGHFLLISSKTPLSSISAPSGVGEMHLLQEHFPALLDHPGTLAPWHRYLAAEGNGLPLLSTFISHLGAWKPL